MKKRLVLLFAMFALASMVALAAGADGKWTSDGSGKGGPQTLTLKSDGNTLTGTLEGGRGSVQITDGKVDGNKVSFNVIRDMGEKGKMTLMYNGEVSGNEIKLTVTREGGQPRDVTFKRAN